MLARQGQRIAQQPLRTLGLASLDVRDREQQLVQPRGRRAEQADVGRAPPQEVLLVPQEVLHQNMSWNFSRLCCVKIICWLHF